ncbi:WD40-repeat-containing domain protein [Flagelloscypha sp. PMI_526]|nr:WD40-repeat-containing domain protein [Flagelloscypha sp. PMI_526]
MSNVSWVFDDDADDNANVRAITLNQLLALMAQNRSSGRRMAAGRRLFLDDEDDDEDTEDNDDLNHSPMEDQLPRPSLATGPTNWFKPRAEPDEITSKLLLTGEFGRVEPKLQRHPRPKSLARMVLDYPSRSRLTKEHVLTNLVPNTDGVAVASCPANIYTGSFSADSSFYYTCSQDFQLHVFDTNASKSARPNGLRRYPQHGQPSPVTSRLHLKHTIQGRPGRWTITDANLSPDNERMIYSSITPTVYMADMKDPTAPQVPICFSDSERTRRAWDWDDGFGIWSCRFSADGNEVVAGGSGNIFVYDLLANRRTVKISAHEADVNSCCWADSSSGNVLVSASDDTFLKVWDRRSLGSSNTPSGVLCGHTQGITYVSSKGDGRYVLSNGKDQAARLWDLRKMCSNKDFETFADKNYGHNHWDYRHESYPRPRWRAHPKDLQLLRTLIRCHFSPVETTGGQYIYSGSADGKIHIWSLDGRIVQILDRSKTLPQSFDASEPEPRARERKARRGHPLLQPIIMSAAWESDRDGSGSLGGKLEDWVAKAESELDERRARYHVPGSYRDWLDEDEDDDDPDYEEDDDEDEIDD